MRMGLIATSGSVDREWTETRLITYTRMRDTRSTILVEATIRESVMVHRRPLVLALSLSVAT